VQKKTNKHTCTKLGAKHDLIVNKNNTKEDVQPMVNTSRLAFFEKNRNHSIKIKTTISKEFNFLAFFQVFDIIKNLKRVGRKQKLSL